VPLGGLDVVALAPPSDDAHANALARDGKAQARMATAPGCFGDRRLSVGRAPKNARKRA
jgi:hypothetical protein